MKSKPMRLCMAAATLALALPTWAATEFKIEDGVLSGYYGDDPSGALRLPEGVREIAKYVFSDCEGITSVSLPDSLRRIGWGAFSGCENLRTVTGGANLEWVGCEAFDETRFVCGDKYFDGFASEAEKNAYWNGLEVVYVGNFAVGIRGSLEAAWDEGGLDPQYSSWFEEYSEYAEICCDNEDFLDIEEYFDRIWHYDLKFKRGVTGVADELFYGIPITSVEMPDTLKYIGEGAFADNRYLRQLKLGKGLVSIGEGAFGNTGWYWSQGLVKGDDGGFLSYFPRSRWTYGVEYSEGYGSQFPTCWPYYPKPNRDDPNCIVSIELPASLKYVGSYAFSECGFLYYVSGVRNDIEYGESVFERTPYYEVSYDREEAWGEICGGNYQLVCKDGVLQRIELHFGLRFDDPCVKNRVLTIPEGITEIAAEAFRNVEECYVRKVVFPSTLRKIGDYAFAGSGIKFVEGLGAGVAMGQGVFDGTPYLKGWDVPAKLVVEDGVLKDVEWEYERHDDGIIVDGVLTIPEGVVEIADGVFSGGFEEVEALVLPKSLKRIGGCAFESCYRLKTVAGGDNVEWVDSGAFYDNPFVDYGKYYRGFASEEEYEAYYNSLELVRVGKFIVGTIGDLDLEWRLLEEDLRARGATVWWLAGKLVMQRPLVDCWHDLVIPEGTVGWTKSAFGGYRYENLPIASVTIPGTVRKIPEDAFCEWPIKSLTLGDGIEEIGAGAFSGTRLTSIDLPKSVRFVGEDAFAGIYDENYDYMLKSVVFRSGLTQFSSWAFDGWDEEENQWYGTEVAFKGEGARFLGWEMALTDDYGAYVVRPVMEANQYTVEFDPNGGKGAMLPATLTYDQLQALPSCKFTRAGYDFLGWALAPDGDVAFLDEEPVENLLTGGTMKLYAVWERGTLWDPVIDDNGGRRAAALDAANATVFNAYASDAAGNTVGLLDIKAAKAKGKKGEALKTSVVTVTVQLLGQKKETVKGTMIVAGGADSEMGVFRGQTKSGRPVLLTFGADGVSGKIGNYSVDGALNKFTAKDAASKAAAAKVLAKRQGAYSVAFKTAGGWNGLSFVVGSKGKTKVTGVLADGSKVSATTQLMIGGDDVCSLAVVYSKKNVNLAFNLWLSDAEVGVSGLDEAIAGKAGALAQGAGFRVDAAALAGIIGDSTYADYFPDGVSVALDGKKFVVAGGAKAGKVALNKEKTGVDAEKAGANPSALKLSYTAKTGAFKGTFKGYVNANGKPKAVSVTVNGVLLDGVGYGAALVKKAGSVSVEIR